MGETRNDLTLWYRQPARNGWRPCPSATGGLARWSSAACETERLQLNEETVWAGGPHDYANPEGLAALPEIRRLVFAGSIRRRRSWSTPGSWAGRRPAAVPDGRRPDAELSALRGRIASTGASWTWIRRSARVTYTADGVRYTREVFASASRPGDRHAADGGPAGPVSFTAAFDSPQKLDDAARDGHACARRHQRRRAGARRRGQVPGAGACLPDGGTVQHRGRQPHRDRARTPSPF